MNEVLQRCAALLHAVAVLLGGGTACARSRERAAGNGYPDAVKLRSWHVDPHRTGMYFPWTRRDE